MKKIFTLQTNLTNYLYPLSKIIISVMVILFSINRGKIFTIPTKSLNIAVTIFCLFATVASILCIYIAIPELFYVRKNRKAKRLDIGVLPTTPFTMEQVVSLVKRNDIIEFELKAKDCVIKVGASSDCNAGSSKFFDKRFYIEKEEYLTIEAFEKALLCYASKGIVYVITIDGVKAEKWRYIFYRSISRSELDEGKRGYVMTFELFQKLMSFETKGRLCIEIFFVVKESEKFDRCWMGKLPERKTKADVFWYGLTPDGKNAYDYPSFEEFSSAKVFDGKSLLEIWDKIAIEEINGCDPAEMVDMYLSGTGL